MHKKVRSIGVILLITMSLTTGCWDRVDINDRALLLGWGMDITDDEKYQATDQFAIPQKLVPGQSGGSKGNAFCIATGVGDNIQEAGLNMQTKLSRPWFAGQRRILLIGDGLAKYGIGEVIDEYSRNPAVRLRTDLMIVKGGTANAFFKQSYPLERLPAFASVNIHQAIGVKPDVTLRDFLMAASSNGDTPVLPAFKMISDASSDRLKQGDENDPIPNIRSFGLAIFDRDLKFKGYLNFKNSITRRWIRGELKTNKVTAFIPGAKGNAAIEMSSLKSKINPVLQGNHMNIHVTLTGKGAISENNTNLDLSQPHNVKVLEAALDKQAEQQALQVIHVSCKRNTGLTPLDSAYSFIVNTQIYQYFADSDISVKANLTIQSVGLTGPSLLSKEDDVKQ
ncbi:Ger(x)C family spore germination protein [Alicyclobacillus fastidiosus]|uniref:Ger(X)C family spore germination protein n=1 Tax=Alicyclobacillus fastidiosus TaxID=392011 RepID=A0ABY6ZD76_9BACL|nr:Ger(x)C family spore germination protein [Alicyclobacillus fastidiosus]WAH40477.1 Ger(x)C family spore germination protein [Alicyclobacillus fastidiosus]GMA61886.1 spore germination protein KC [Alicyclobacillus fastidiosus]